MAALHVSNGTPSCSTFSSPQNPSPSQSKMYDLPQEYSSAQLEAKKVFARLLDRLRDTDSKYYAKYGKWVERNSRLEDFCFQCIRPQVWTFLSGRWSLDSIKTIGGDLRFDGRGVYLDGLLGLDKRVRIYIGQATSIRQRVGQHLNFRYRRDNPSLHYHAMQYSIYNSIGCLALLPSPGLGNHTLPGMDQPDLLLNVLEMWMCLVFRTLPTQTLEAWLLGLEGTNANRKVGKEGEFGGLNIASPIDHGEKARGWIDLSESDDPLVLDYIGHGKKSMEADTRKRSDIESVNKATETESDGFPDSPTERRAKYAEKARRFTKSRQQEIQVPSWLLLGGLAITVGIMLYNSSGGPRPKPRLGCR